MPCSSPVKLWTPIMRLAVSTSLSRSTEIAGSSTLIGEAILGADVREHLLAEQPDLPVPVVAPQLEHDVRAAGVAVLLDRGDAVGRCAGDRLALVEERVRDLRLGGEPASLLHRLGDG